MSFWTLRDRKGDGDDGLAKLEIKFKHFQVANFRDGDEILIKCQQTTISVYCC